MQNAYTCISTNRVKKSSQNVMTKQYRSVRSAKLLRLRVETYYNNTSTRAEIIASRVAKNRPKNSRATLRTTYLITHNGGDVCTNEMYNQRRRRTGMVSDRWRIIRRRLPFHLQASLSTPPQPP